MALNQYDSCPFKKQKRHQEDVNTEKVHVRTQGDGGHLQAKERPEESLNLLTL